MIIIWVLLADLVILAAFFLALKSMSDYKEKPENFKQAYGLFLIQNQTAINPELLSRLHKQIIKRRFIISLERLYKGPKKALVIFGPKSVLEGFKSELDLLELEDYTQNIHLSNLSVLSLPLVETKSFDNLETLEDEQLWWQLVLQPAGGNIIETIYLIFQRLFSAPYQLINKRLKKVANPVSEDSDKSKEKFYSSLTVAILSNDAKRREELQGKLPLAIPTRQSLNHRFDNFKQRSLPLSIGLSATVTPTRIVQLLHPPQ